MSDNKFPLVSVVITCYNLGAYIEEAIKSVRDQSYENYEILIIDDGSTDKNTIELIAKIKGRDDDIHVITQNNMGVSEARNNGIRIANGEYIVCLDADDKLDREYIQKTMLRFKTSRVRNLGFVTIWVKEFGDRENVWKTKGYSPALLLIENIVCGTSMFKKEAWLKAGGYKKAMDGGYEDWEFWLSLVECGYKWDVVPEPLFFYRIRNNSRSLGANNKHAVLYQRLIGFHEKLSSRYAKEVISLMADKIHDLHAVIKVRNEQIDTYCQQINNLKEAFDDLKEVTDLNAQRLEEFDQISLSRVTKPAIELRKILIAGRNRFKSGCRIILNFIKRITPKPFKVAFKSAFKMIFGPRLIFIKNNKWKKDEPLVSIVTPFFNQGDDVGETIRSVVSQTYKNIEYIIVNDGSDVKEKKKLLNIIADQDIILIDHEENIGKGSPAAARNSGIKIARGKYIVCLDGDDILDPTYIEKCAIVLEANPSLGLVSTRTQSFGMNDEAMHYCEYDPMILISNNIITTAAMFRREAWKVTGGYKTGIGYEDWEFWINMAENGFFGRLITEPLFFYRTAKSSRFTEDKKKHKENVEKIRSIHPNYSNIVKPIWRRYRKNVVKSKADSVFINLNKKLQYIQDEKVNILILIPWMSFGGAETLTLNFCREIRDSYDIHFVTGLESDNEWEDRFKELSPNVYHLPNLFKNDDNLYLEFISNYIKTRNIDVLHIIHTDYAFGILSEIKKRYPEIKVVISMFNDRVPHYFIPSVELEEYVDMYVSDNLATTDHYKQVLPDAKPVLAIPNGVDCYDIFNPVLFNDTVERTSLGINQNDVAVFFIGRLSEEKNPNVFIDVAERVINKLGDECRVKFFIIGDGAMRHEIEKRIDGINSKNIEYLGYQTNIARFLRAADIFVLPSSIEGFPLSILEAMSMGVATIASDVGAVSDIIEDGKDGFVVRPGSTDDISELIIKLQGDKKLLSGIKNASREKVENKFSNEILKNNYLKMYKDVLK